MTDFPDLPWYRTSLPEHVALSMSNGDKPYRARIAHAFRPGSRWSICGGKALPQQGMLDQIGIPADHAARVALGRAGDPCCANCARLLWPEPATGCLDDHSAQVPSHRLELGQAQRLLKHLAHAETGVHVQLREIVVPDVPDLNGVVHLIARGSLTSDSRSPEEVLDHLKYLKGAHGVDTTIRFDLDDAATSAARGAAPSRTHAPA